MITSIEHDAIFLAKILAKGYAEQTSQHIAVTSEPPWSVVERLAAKRYPLHSSMLASGKVPEPADRLRWIRGSYGAIRVVSRDGAGTTFAVCFPENAQKILECIMADKSYTQHMSKESMKLAYQFTLEVKDGWTVSYVVHSTAGKEVLKGSLTHVHLDACVHGVMDAIVSGVNFEPHTRRDDRRFFPEGLGASLMAFPYKPFVTMCMLGFLYGSYQTLMHYTMTFGRLLDLMAWVPAAGACYYLPRWIGAMLVRIANARRTRYFQKGR